MDVYWEGAQVGDVRILPRASSRLTLEQRSDSLQNVSDLLYLPSSANISATGKNDEPGNANATNELSYGAFGNFCKYRDDESEVLSVSEVIGAVFAGSRYMAALFKDDRMNSIIIAQSTGIDAKVLFGGTDSLHVAQYQYEYVTRTSNAMVFWLLNQGRLAEMDCAILDGRRWVGTAFLEKSGRPD